METVADRFPTMEELAKLYGYAIDDPKIVQHYDLYEEAWREEQSRKDYLERLEREAVEKGMAGGVEKGIEKGRRDTLEQLVAEGLLSPKDARRYMPQ